MRRVIKYSSSLVERYRTNKDVYKPTFYLSHPTSQSLYYLISPHI